MIKYSSFLETIILFNIFVDLTINYLTSQLLKQRRRTFTFRVSTCRRGLKQIFTKVSVLCTRIFTLEAFCFLLPTKKIKIVVDPANCNTAYGHLQLRNLRKSRVNVETIIHTTGAKYSKAVKE